MLQLKFSKASKKESAMLCPFNAPPLRPLKLLLQGKEEAILSAHLPCKQLSSAF